MVERTEVCMHVPSLELSCRREQKEKRKKEDRVLGYPGVCILLITCLSHDTWRI